MVEVKAEPPVGFPGDCPTNAYVLEGFAHVVYMVSTVAGANAGSDTSTISRLRNAERELRSQSLLVSLDPETSELFTFHRLLDLQKEGKVIYGRLAMVLQRNQCIISFRCALRATDLLKDEHTRLKGMMLAAVFSAVRPSLLDDVSYIPLGMRSFLRSRGSDDVQRRPQADGERKIWQVETVDLQLLAHGQVLVVNILRKPEHFWPVSDILIDVLDREGNLVLLPSTLCLAPTGQMARYTNGQVLPSTTNALASTRPGTAQSARPDPGLEDARVNIWKEGLLPWLAEQGIHSTDLDTDYWVDIEVPVSLDEEDTGADEAISLTWQRVCWPAQLCFVTQPYGIRVDHNVNIPTEDPLAFLQDWMVRSDERTREISRGISNTKIGDDVQDELTNDKMEEEFGFGNTPQMHHTFSAGLPPSQMMYPTPPDVPYTQATPGMSSIDGVGMTPADTTRLVLSGTEQQPDVEMEDHLDVSGVGTGTYDEDLFEDLPTDRFGSTGPAEEPDWDFFEQQNADVGKARPHMDDAEKTTTVTTRPKVEEDTGDSDILRSRHDNSQDSMLPPQLCVDSPTHAVASPPIDLRQESMPIGGDLNATVTSDDESEQAQSTVDVPVEHSGTSQTGLQDRSAEQSQNVEIWKKPPLPTGRGRRRSLYDSSEDLANIRDHDDRYAANGTFFFDVVASGRPGGANEAPTKTRDKQAQINAHEIASPGSSSADSRSETSSFYQLDHMELDEENYIAHNRKWTEYEQLYAAQNFGLNAEKLAEIEADTRRLLKLLLPVNLDNTWLFENVCQARTLDTKPPRSVDNSSMAAQILVDQLTQTCMPYGEDLILQGTKFQIGQNSSSITLESPYGKVEPATFTSLAKITDNALREEAASRVGALERHQLCLSRVDKSLAISTTALTLWETLNLQPKGGSKDVQAYCVHPASANLDATCEMFLERLGETYIGCNFGDHSVGQSAGTSNDGLVSWSDQTDGIPKLQQCCERLGTALARLPSSSKNVVIYMLTGPAPGMSPTNIVEAFCVLFEAYVKACNKQDPVELALQIVPIDFVTSPDRLVVRSSQEYMSLAVEVYNRLPPAKLGDKLAVCGSAVVLSESPRRRVRFDMAGQNDTLRETGSQCLHVSYSFSNNRDWLVAAWTDERGFKALTMCYVLRDTDSSKSRALLDIIHDIWDISQEMMTRERGYWRLVVARDGFYEASEVNGWATESNNNSGVTKCALTLVSVDLDPILSPQPSQSQAKVAPGATPQPPLHNYGTPVSTPQASTTSPDQYLTATPTPSGSVAINAPTPPEAGFDPNNEADLTIQDPMEESWSVVLPLGLNQSHEVLVSRPALLSGFLLKRRGLRDEDGLCRLGVNLVYTSTSLQIVGAREELLSDILGQYRGLVTLARTRGCIDPVHDLVPWHVATSIKGARVLSRWM